MNLITIIKTLEYLQLNIFTLDDLIKITNQKKEVIKNKLTRLVAQKKIFRIKKGYYSIKKINDKFQLQRTYNQTYICLQSALEYYGSTTQRFNNLDLITKKALNNQEINKTKITFHKVKKEMFFGYQKNTINNTEIFISNIEKTIIDCIYFSSKVYLTDTIDFIKKFKNKIDITLLKTYLHKINSSALNKRTGYLLELQGIKITGLKINNKYEKLNNNLQNKGTKNKKWKLIINEEL